MCIALNSLDTVDVRKSTEYVVTVGVLYQGHVRKQGTETGVFFTNTMSVSVALDNVVHARN